MSADIKSYDETWLEFSYVAYGTCSHAMNDIYEAYDSAHNAIREVHRAGDIGSLSLETTFSDIEDLNENRRKLVSFCNGIHYELSERVDNPFSLALGETAAKAIDLNPSAITVKSRTNIFVADKVFSLTDLIGAAIVDDALQEDFQNKVSVLDHDEISVELEQAIKEAVFWQQEFEKANECRAIAERIFTPEIRAEWANMSPQERAELINQYKNEIGTVLGNGENITTADVKYDASGFGVSRSGSMEIALNPNFINDANKNYSVDKIIDTTTHEMRHQYQSVVKRDPDEYDIPENILAEWNLPYVQYDAKKGNYFDYYEQPIEEDAKAFAALARPE